MTSETTFTFTPAVEGLNVTREAYLASHPHIQRLMTGIVVFSTTSSSPRVLVLRRAAEDSYPLNWEVPGGGVDATDASLLAAAARELREETALRVSRFLAPVLMVDETHPAHTVPRDVQLTFGVAPEDEDDKVDADGLAVTFMETGRVWGKATVLAEVVDEGEVACDPKEHDEWRWLSEKEALECRFEDGTGIKWTSDGVRKTVLEAFRLRTAGEV